MFKSILNKLFNRKAQPAYYCKALQGESSYNICINCDMTISCNCQDFDGRGHIGDLKQNTFEEIFFGKIANSYRKKLALGKLPIPLCARCEELKAVPGEDARNLLGKAKIPHIAIMVENTVICNLQCVYCHRDKIYGLRSQKGMSLNDMELVARILQQHKISAISFHNLGEPFVSDTVAEELALLIRYNPNLLIYLSTNGALINTKEKLEACLLLEHMYFSIAGPTQEILTKYQAGGNFAAAYRHLQQVVQLRNSRGKTRPTIEWKYVVFSWNDAEEQVEAAIQLARDAGVDLISFMQGGAPPESWSHRYTQSDYFQSLGNPSWRGREIWLNNAEEA